MLDLLINCFLCELKYFVPSFISSVSCEPFLFITTDKGEEKKREELSASTKA